MYVSVTFLQKVFLKISSEFVMLITSVDLKQEIKILL